MIPLSSLVGFKKAVITDENSSNWYLNTDIEKKNKSIFTKPKQHIENAYYKNSDSNIRKYATGVKSENTAKSNFDKITGEKASFAIDLGLENNPFHQKENILKTNVDVPKLQIIWYTTDQSIPSSKIIIEKPKLAYEIPIKPLEKRYTGQNVVNNEIKPSSYINIQEGKVHFPKITYYDNVVLTTEKMSVPVFTNKQAIKDVETNKNLVMDDIKPSGSLTVNKQYVSHVNLDNSKLVYKFKETYKNV